MSKNYTLITKKGKESARHTLIGFDLNKIKPVDYIGTWKDAEQIKILGGDKDVESRLIKYAKINENLIMENRCKSIEVILKLN